MDHHFHITIGLDCDTLKLVRELFNQADGSGLEAALTGFEQKTADLKAATEANTPPSTPTP